jgi:zinc protease
VLVDERPAGTPTVAIEVRVRGAGPASETDADSGAAHFIEHLVFKGTADRMPGTLDAAVEALGGEITAYTQRDATRFAVTVPAANWRPALALLAEMLQRPAFRPADVEAERAVVLAEKAVAKGDAYRSGLAALCAAAFAAPDPYRLPLLGGDESVRRLTAADLRAFHARLYRPDNLTVAVAGPVTADEVQAAVRQQFPSAAGGVEPEAPPPAAAVPLIERPVRAPVVPAAPGRGLTTVYVAFRAPAAAAPDAAACEALAQVLARPGSGPLYRRLLQPGRALAATAEYVPLRRGGLFLLSATAAATASPADLEAELLGALAQVREDGVAEMDLTAAQGALIGRSLYERETPEGWARLAADADVLDLPPDFLAGYAARIRAITAADATRAARTYLVPLHRAVAVVSAAATGGDAR